MFLRNECNSSVGNPGTQKNGMPLIPVASSQSGLAQVSLVKSVTIPSEKHCHVRVNTLTS